MKKISQFPHLLIPTIKRWVSVVKNRRSFRFSRRAVAIFWAALVLVYVIGAVVVGYSIYKKHKDTSFIRNILAIYPLPAASVNNQVITVKSVYDQMFYIHSYASVSQQDVGSDEELVKQIINQRIEDAVVREQAVKYRAGVTKKQVDDALDKIYQENGGKEEVKKIIAGYYQMSLDDFKNLLGTKLIKDRLEQEILKQVKIAHILVQDEKTANKVNDDINNNKIGFEDAAKQYSQDSTSKDKGGELDFASRNRLPKEIEDQVFDKTKGTKIEKPIKTSYGFHIVKVIDVRGDIDKSLSDWLNELKEKAKVKRYLYK